MSAQLEAQTLHHQLNPMGRTPEHPYLDRISVAPQARRDFTICTQIPDPDLLVHATRGEQLVVATDCQREHVTLMANQPRSHRPHRDWQELPCALSCLSYLLQTCEVPCQSPDPLHNPKVSSNLGPASNLQRITLESFEPEKAVASSLVSATQVTEVLHQTDEWRVDGAAAAHRWPLNVGPASAGCNLAAISA